MQHILSSDQIKSFHIDVFVRDQIHDFKTLFGEVFHDFNVVDIGGGVGFFAKKMQEDLGIKVRIIDADYDSVGIAIKSGLSAEIGDAIKPNINGNEDVACFNLVLHHLVGNSEFTTNLLQKKSLEVWRGSVKAIFVNEYIYESHLFNTSGRLIFLITQNKILSKFCKIVASFIPSLMANTFGVGVRFRSSAEWQMLFNEAGFKVDSFVAGDNEYVSFPRKLLLIKKIHRVSFKLIPIPLSDESIV